MKTANLLMQSNTKPKHCNLDEDHFDDWQAMTDASRLLSCDWPPLCVLDHHWYFHKDAVVFTDMGKWIAEIPFLCTMEISPTVEVRHCSPTPEHHFTPETVKHHSFAVNFISTITHIAAFFGVQQSLTRNLWRIWSLPSPAADHWQGQEEGS